MFKCNKSTDSKRYWICIEGGCGVSIQTKLNNDFLSISGDHNHTIDPDVLQRKVLKEKMKDRILTETTSIITIYDEEIAKATLSEAVEQHNFLRLSNIVRILLEKQMSNILYLFSSVIRFRYEQSSIENNTGDPNIMRLRHPASLSRNNITQTFFIDGFFKTCKGTCDSFFN